MRTISSKFGLRSSEELLIDLLDLALEVGTAARVARQLQRLQRPSPMLFQRQAPLVAASCAP